MTTAQKDRMMVAPENNEGNCYALYPPSFGWEAISESARIDGEIECARRPVHCTRRGNADRETANLVRP